MPDLFLFIDTEFTSFAKPTLISLALVSQYTPRGDCFSLYLESNEYDRAQCSEFVIDHVLPLLNHQAVSYQAMRQSVTHYLQSITRSLGDEANKSDASNKKNDREETFIYIVGDDARDWQLFSQLMQPLDKKGLKIAGFLNLFDYLHYTIHQKVKSDDAAKQLNHQMQALFSSHVNDWFQKHNKIMHHALDDAKANCYAFGEFFKLIASKNQ